VAIKYRVERANWPVLSGYQPDIRAYDELTEWCKVPERSTRRQIATDNGQVGRSTQSD